MSLKSSQPLVVVFDHDEDIDKEKKKGATAGRARGSRCRVKLPKPTDTHSKNCFPSDRMQLINVVQLSLLLAVAVVLTAGSVHGPLILQIHSLPSFFLLGKTSRRGWSVWVLYSDYPRSFPLLHLTLFFIICIFIFIFICF